MPEILITTKKKTAFYKTLDDANELPVYLDKGTKVKNLSHLYFYREPFADLPFNKVEHERYGVGYIPVETK